MSSTFAMAQPSFNGALDPETMRAAFTTLFEKFAALGDKNSIAQLAEVARTTFNMPDVANGCEAHLRGSQARVTPSIPAKIVVEPKRNPVSFPSAAPIVVERAAIWAPVAAPRGIEPAIDTWNVLPVRPAPIVTAARVYWDAFASAAAGAQQNAVTGLNKWRPDAGAAVTWVEDKFLRAASATQRTLAGAIAGVNTATLSSGVVIGHQILKARAMMQAYVPAPVAEPVAMPAAGVRSTSRPTVAHIAKIMTAENAAVIGAEKRATTFPIVGKFGRMSSHQLGLSIAAIYSLVMASSVLWAVIKAEAPELRKADEAVGSRADVKAPDSGSTAYTKLAARVDTVVDAKAAAFGGLSLAGLEHGIPFAGQKVRGAGNSDATALAYAAGKANCKPSASDIPQLTACGVSDDGTIAALAKTAPPVRGAGTSKVRLTAHWRGVCHETGHRCVPHSLHARADRGEVRAHRKPAAALVSSGRNKEGQPSVPAFTQATFFSTHSR